MLIGLGTQKQVGKDSFYKIICSNYPFLPIKRLAFADPLKMEIYSHMLEPYGLPYDLIENKDISRLLLQSWGEFRRRTISPNYWVDRLAEQLIDVDKNIYVITDVRYENEAEFVKKNSGFLIKIVRGSDNYQDSHSSEQSLLGYQGFDLVLENNSTFEKFEQDVLSVFKNNILDKFVGNVLQQT